MLDRGRHYQVEALLKISAIDKATMRAFDETCTAANGDCFSPAGASPPPQVDIRAQVGGRLDGGVGFGNREQARSHRGFVVC